MQRWFLLGLVLLALTACGGAPTATIAPTSVPTTPPTATIPACATTAYATVAQPLLMQWTDAINLASNTPRMQLATQIATLQDLRRQATQLEVPDCVKPTHQLLVDSMDNSINGFLAFLGQRDDNPSEFTVAARLLARYSTELPLLANPVVAAAATSRALTPTVAVPTPMYAPSMFVDSAPNVMQSLAAQGYAKVITGKNLVYTSVDKQRVITFVGDPMTAITYRGPYSAKANALNDVAAVAVTAFPSAAVEIRTEIDRLRAAPTIDKVIDFSSFRMTLKGDAASGTITMTIE